MQVRFRKGEAVRLEGVAGTAEGNPLLQADPQFYDFFEDKATDLKVHIVSLSPQLQSSQLSKICFRPFKQSGRTWQWTGMEAFPALFEIWGFV